MEPPMGPLDAPAEALMLTCRAAAELAGVSERTMRRWLKRGKVAGAHKVAPNRYAIPLDALRALMGMTLAARAATTAASHATLAGLQHDLAALRARVALLETRMGTATRLSLGPPLASAPMTASAGPSAATPYTMRHTASGTPATFTHRADAARWLLRHGIQAEGTPKTWPGWRDVGLEPHAVLGLALSLCDPSNHRITWRLHRCADAACVCHEMLPA